MAVKDRLIADLESAIRSGDSIRVSVIRFLRNGIQYEEKTQGKPLDDDGVHRVLSRQVNEHRESIHAFEAGGRTDLVDKEKAELVILESYLPPQLTADELMGLVRQVVAEVGAARPEDKGKVMGRLMPQIRGKADGAVANQLVTSILAGEL